MSDQTQFDIVQQILSLSISVAKPGWQEMILHYYVEGDRSAFVNTYLIDEGGKAKEESLPDVDDLDDWFRRLRAHLKQMGEAAFTSARIHLMADGNYKAHYTYDPVDWDALLEPDWNFFPSRSAARV